MRYSACRVIVPVFTSQPAISESLSLPTNVYTSRRHLASTCFTTQEALTTGMFTTGMKASASSFSYASRPVHTPTSSPMRTNSFSMYFSLAARRSCRMAGVMCALSSTR